MSVAPADEPLDPLPVALQFMQALWSVVHGLDRASKRMAATLGVTGPQRLALRVVGLYPGLSAGDVARILHVHPSTLTGILDRLVAQGLVRRAVDPVDRRRAVLHLTPRGLAVNRERHGTVEAAVSSALRTLSARDRSIAARVLRRLAGRLAAGATTTGARPGALALATRAESRRARTSAVAGELSGMGESTRLRRHRKPR
jgi:DNA-binding MarR family transcriptional regulator